MTNSNMASEASTDEARILSVLTSVHESVLNPCLIRATISRRLRMSATGVASLITVLYSISITSIATPQLNNVCAYYPQSLDFLSYGLDKQHSLIAAFAVRVLSRVNLSNGYTRPGNWQRAVMQVTSLMPQSFHITWHRISDKQVLCQQPTVTQVTQLAWKQPVEGIRATHGIGNTTQEQERGIAPRPARSATIPTRRQTGSQVACNVKQAPIRKGTGAGMPSGNTIKESLFGDGSAMFPEQCLLKTWKPKK